MKRINLNVLASELCKQEGLKVSVNVAQTKEIINLMIKRMRLWTVEEMAEVLQRKLK